MDLNNEDSALPPNFAARTGTSSPSDIFNVRYLLEWSEELPSVCKSKTFENCAWVYYRGLGLRAVN